MTKSILASATSLLLLASSADAEPQSGAYCVAPVEIVTPKGLREATSDTAALPNLPQAIILSPAAREAPMLVTGNRPPSKDGRPKLWFWRFGETGILEGPIDPATIKDGMSGIGDMALAQNGEAYIELIGEFEENSTLARLGSDGLPVPVRGALSDRLGDIGRIVRAEALGGFIITSTRWGQVTSGSKSKPRHETLLVRDDGSITEFPVEPDFAVDVPGIDGSVLVARSSIYVATKDSVTLAGTIPIDSLHRRDNRHRWWGIHPFGQGWVYAEGDGDFGSAFQIVQDGDAVSIGKVVTFESAQRKTVFDSLFTSHWTDRIAYRRSPQTTVDGARLIFSTNDTDLHELVDGEISAVSEDENLVGGPVKFGLKQRMHSATSSRYHYAAIDGEAPLSFDSPSQARTSEIRLRRALRQEITILTEPDRLVVTPSEIFAVQSGELVSVYAPQGETIHMAAAVPKWGAAVLIVGPAHDEIGAIKMLRKCSAPGAVNPG